jgi:hypothetical protein
VFVQHAGNLTAFSCAFRAGQSAEPALNTLGLVVERLTRGQFRRKVRARATRRRRRRDMPAPHSHRGPGHRPWQMLVGAVSVGVATGVTVGVLRLIYNVRLIYVRQPGAACAAGHCGESPSNPQGASRRSYCRPTPSRLASLPSARRSMSVWPGTARA